MTQHAMAVLAAAMGKGDVVLLTERFRRGSGVVEQQRQAEVRFMRHEGNRVVLAYTGSTVMAGFPEAGTGLVTFALGDATEPAWGFGVALEATGFRVRRCEFKGVRPGDTAYDLA